MICTESFNSINPVGKDKPLKNYKHLLNTLFQNEKFDELKQSWEKIEQESLLVFSDDWTDIEKINVQKTLLGYFDKNIIVGKFLSAFKKFGVQAVDDVPDNKDKKNVWCLVEDVKTKETKTSKSYYLVSSTGSSDKVYNFKVWDPTDEWKVGNIMVVHSSVGSQTLKL